MTPAPKIRAATQTLIDHAKQRGGADNITCMMLRVVETPLAASEAPPSELVPEPHEPQPAAETFAHQADFVSPGHETAADWSEHQVEPESPTLEQ